MITPDIQSVRILSKKHTFIPLYERLPLKGLKAQVLYEQFRKPYTCLIERVDKEKNQHYEVIGLHASKRFESDGKTTILHKDGKESKHTGNPYTMCEEQLRYDSPIYPELDVFTGGAIGHFNYDMVRLFENIDDKEKDTLGLPMMHLLFVDEVLVLDYTHGYLYVIVNIASKHCERDYEIAKQRIISLCEQVRLPYEQFITEKKDTHTIHSNLNKEEFITMVNKAKDYISQGDIFQVVLSQRLESSYKNDPFHAYRQLTSSKNSPYMYYLDFDTYVIAGMSPEMLLTCLGTKLQTMPIAGTRKRGSTTQEDELLMVDLLQDKKELCEHMMLVDLARNDMGRVAQIGSVEVHDRMSVQLYSHVMHMTTRVDAILAEHKTAFDALASLFPAGTLSGAPKIRAMQIIDELEQTRREVYGGVIAMIGYNGFFDTCITIRTFLFHKQKVYIQAGAGIVKDSDPEKEYQETIHKASALLEAIGCEVEL